MKEIKVGWAILTKQPEDAEDYQVLAYSAGELNAGSYHDLMHRWMTGEVPYEPKFRIPATPWYQFGIIKEPIRQVVLQQKWTGYSDYRNRPVLETICLLLPFEKLAEVSCGYKQMVDIFEQEGVKAFFTERMGEISRGIGKTEYEEISILLPEREEVSEWVRRAIKEVGAEISMRAADLLLRNPLMIYAGGQVKSVEERVKWLDAVMAMLPYGLRADCPVSLWASSSARHGMRLYWGDMVREGHGYIEVSKQGKENGEKVKLGSYMGELELIWGRVSQEEILNYLAEQSEERSFQNPIPDDFFNKLKNRFKNEHSKILIEKERSIDNSVIQDHSDLGESIPIPEKTKNNIDDKKRKEFFLLKIKKRNKNLKDQEFDKTSRKIVSQFKNTRIPLDYFEIQKNILDISGNVNIYSLFDNLSREWTLISPQYKNKRKIILLKLLQYTLEQEDQSTNKRPLIDWVANRMKEDFWYDWIYIIVNSKQPLSYKPILRCLEVADYKKSYIKTLLKYSTGLISYRNLDNRFLELTFNDKKTQYSIWLVIFLAQYKDMDYVKFNNLFLNIAKWLIKKKDITLETYKALMILMKDTIVRRKLDRKSLAWLDQLIKIL